MLNCCSSRSHIQEGVKTKKWDDRMEKVQREKAIKKLQAELKEEKETDRKRCATPHFDFTFT